MERLQQALLQLDITNDNHWTESGLPRIDTLKFLTGDTTITREIIHTIAPKFTRQDQSLTEPELAPISDGTLELIGELAIKLTPNDELSTEDRLNKELELLEKLTSQMEEFKKQVLAQTIIVHSLNDEIQKESTDDKSQLAIQEYLKSQQGVLNERAIKLQMISESGIKLRDLAEGLRSPLDTSLSHKRR